MYINISEHCKEVLSRSSRKFTASIILDDNNEKKYDAIKSYTLTKGSSSEETPLIGSTVANSLEIIIQLPEGITLKGHKLELIQCVLLEDGTYEDIPCGHYIVSQATVKSGLTTVKAEGYLSAYGEKAYFSKLNYPSDTLSVLKEIAGMSGMIISTKNLNALKVTTKPEGYTYREVLGYIAAMYGRFAVEMRDGSIELKWYEYCSDDILTDKISEPELEEKEAAINVLKCTITDGKELSKGNGINGLNINNPLMTDEAMNVAWQQIGNFSYVPGKINIMSATPCMDVWDIYKYGESNIISCTSIFTYDGGLQCEISSEGIIEADNVSSKGPVTKQLERYYAELVLINKAMINKLSAEEADIRYAQIEKLDVIQENVEKSVIGELENNFANIKLANINIADIGKFLANSGILCEVMINNGSVTGTLNGVKINGDLIIANTLKVKDLLLEGDDGLIYQINALASGLTKTELTDEIYKKKLDGTDIIANSITSNQIASQTITSNEINLIELFSKNITATGTITGMTLKGANAEITKGKIGDFIISDGNITITQSAYINPTYANWQTIHNFANGTKTPTAAQILVSDFNVDGKIALFDSLVAKKMILGDMTIDDAVKNYGYDAKKSNVTFKINSKDPTKTIEITGTNAWGSAIDNYVGINGIKTTTVKAEGIKAGTAQISGDVTISGDLDTALWKGSGNNGLIDTRTVTLSGTVAASSTGTLSGTFTIPTGYSSVGIVGYNLATYSLCPVRMTVAGSSVSTAVRNLTASAITVTSAYAIVLLIKN